MVWKDVWLAKYWVVAPVPVGSGVEIVTIMGISVALEVAKV